MTDDVMNACMDEETAATGGGPYVALFDYTDDSTLYADGDFTTPVNPLLDGPLSGVIDSSGNGNYLARDFADSAHQFIADQRSGFSASKFNGGPTQLMYLKSKTATGNHLFTDINFEYFGVFDLVTGSSTFSFGEGTTPGATEVEFAYKLGSTIRVFWDSAAFINDSNVVPALPYVVGYHNKDGDLRVSINGVIQNTTTPPSAYVQGNGGFVLGGGKNGRSGATRFQEGFTLPLTDVDRDTVFDAIFAKFPFLTDSRV